MNVDEGDIAGGFARTYDAWRVDDPDTPMMRALAEATGSRRERAASFGFARADGTSWTRKFAGIHDTGRSPCAFTTPIPDVVGISVHGNVYLVDVQHPDETSKIDLLHEPALCAVADHDRGRLYFASPKVVQAFDGVRVLWTSRELALSEITKLSYAKGKIRGASLGVGPALAFVIDARTGAAQGGYRGPSIWRFMRGHDPQQPIHHVPPE